MRRRKTMADAALCVAAILLAPLATAAVAVAAPPGQSKNERVRCAPPPDWSSCVEVTSRLDRAPALGEVAQLVIEVKSLVDVDKARIEADLPSALRWDSQPSGWRLDRLPPLLPEDGAGVARAWRVVNLKAGETFEYTARVRGVATASTSLRVRVSGPDTSPLDDDAHMLLLTVGQTGAASHLGLNARSNSTAMRELPDGVPMVKSAPHLTFQPVSPKGLPAPHSDDPKSGEPSTQAISCVRGVVGYEFPAGTGHPSPNIQVQAWDEDPANSDDLLDIALTDANGGFRLCFDNGNDAHGGQDVYIKVIAENGLWRVTDDGFFGRDTYEFQSAQRDDIPDGRTIDYGRLTPADAALHRVLHAFDLANDAQEWTPGECWDDRDTGDCRRMEVVYPDDDSDNNSRYDWDSNTVFLEPASPDDRTDTVHEYGHAVMDDAYNDEKPDTPNCFPVHAMDTRSSQGCAWVEGFANFYPMAIYNQDEYRGWHVEDTSTYDTGDDTEGRVTGSLWDLTDPRGERYWDDWQESARAAIWDTLLDRNSHTFREFWTHRGQEGHDVGPGPLGALYQNSIDYGFRNPLADGVALTRPTPEQQHNYRFDTTFRFWSVVALRPPTGIDYDLYLYDDEALQQQLESSVLPVDTIDFVAINSNVREPGDYFPVVRRPSFETGTGEYRIELAATARLLSGTTTQAMAGLDDVVAVWDTCPLPGTDVTITVTPSDPSQDAELFLMRTDPARPDTTVRSRSAAQAESTGNAAGQPESLTFSPQGGCYGVVLINRAGSGTYTLSLS